MPPSPPLPLATIQTLSALPLLDGLGEEALEVTIRLTDGSQGRALTSVRADGPSARDLDWVLRHVLAPRLEGHPALDQAGVDRLMLELDATAERQELGSALVLGVSLATARAAAASQGLPLYRYLGGLRASRLPAPVLEVGASAPVQPLPGADLRRALRQAFQVRSTVRAKLRQGAAAAPVGAMVQALPEPCLQAVDPALLEAGTVIDLNEIGTLAETMDWSARSSLPEDGRELIVAPGTGVLPDAAEVDLAVALGAARLLVGDPGGPGGLARTNRLLQLAENLGQRGDGSRDGAPDGGRRGAGGAGGGPLPARPPVAQPPRAPGG
jgi:enolase